MKAWGVFWITTVRTYGLASLLCWMTCRYQMSHDDMIRPLLHLGEGLPGLHLHLLVRAGDQHPALRLGAQLGQDLVKVPSTV